MRSCRSYTELTIGNNATLLGSGYDPNKPPMVLIHGWLQTPRNQPFIFPVATARRKSFQCAFNAKQLLGFTISPCISATIFVAVYCEHEYPYNLIIFDSSAAYDFWTYVLFVCCGLTRVSTEGAEFIKWLHEVEKTDPETTQISGWSLGGQLGAGTAAKLSEMCRRVLIRKVTGKKELN